MIPNWDRLVSWVDQLSLDRDIFGWVVVEMVGVFSSDLVGWDRSIPLMDRFGGCGDLPTPPFGHPSVRVASAFAEEGTFMRDVFCLRL